MRSLRPRLRAADVRSARPLPKRAEAFYLTPEWSAFRDRILRERGRRCQHIGCQAPTAPGIRILHHIRERRDGGADFDPSNVAVVCSTCHGHVTHAARAARLSSHPDPGDGV